MASGALFRRGLVEQNRFTIHFPAQLMTAGAPHVLVRAAQCEFSALVMIKQRRFPFHAVVTFDAARDAGLRELLAMHVLVTVFALRRSSFEIHIQQPGFKIGWFVAVDARGRAVRSQQGEFRLRVIEAREFPPGLCGVASLAPGR